MSTASVKDLFYLAALPMSRNALHKSTNDPPAPHHNHTEGRASVLIFISAQAIGSLGFALSLFAIWFGWLLPASTSTSSAVESLESKESKNTRVPHRHHRRSLPSSGPPRLLTIRRVSAPVDITPILASHVDDGQDHSRHVYFADSSAQPITRRNTMPEGSQLTAGSLTNFPLSSPIALPVPDSPDEGTLDSDSPHSSKASLQRPPSRLQKLRLFNVKSVRSESHDKHGDQASITSTETNSNGSEKSTRRASGGFVASWSLSRNRTAPDVLNPDSCSPSPSRMSFGRSRVSPSRPPNVTTSSCPADFLSPTFLSRKSQNRVSAPIPRTSPYGAPYFASPPILLDNSYPSYLKTLPQFEDEMQTRSAPASDTDDPERARGRTPAIRRVSLKDPRRCVPKRRSASEDWSPRQDKTS